MSNTASLPPVVCVMGPTASGKTALGLELAHHFDGEIISVDSALVYRHMDIGTAKPTEAEQQGIPHHLINICEPQQVYSAAEFRTDALNLIEQIHARGRLPILVGGTGFYFRALEQGMSELPASDPEIRDALIAELETQGNVHMHARLQQVDPQSAERLHANDSQRILRALEVYAMTGEPMSKLWAQQQQQKPSLRFIKLAIAPAERAVLHQRIAKRFEHMLSQGLVDEVKSLRNLPNIHAELPSMRSVGYRQVWQYLDGEYDYETMKEKGITATRQLAKRQFTWLRREENVEWFDSESVNVLSDIVSFVSKHLEK